MNEMEELLRRKDKKEVEQQEQIKQMEASHQASIKKLEATLTALMAKVDEAGVVPSAEYIEKIETLQSENDGLVTRLSQTNDAFKGLQSDNELLQGRLDGVVRALDEVTA